MKLTPRQQREIAHDRKILENSEKIWGRSGLVGSLRLQRRAKMIKNFFNLDKTKKVLELGCGTGSLTKYLAPTGARIIAIDIFPEFLRIAREKIPSLNVTFMTADAEELTQFADEDFDAVCGLSMLHHIDVKKSFKNIFRVLKTGGKIAFSEPNMLNPQVAAQKNIPIIKKIFGDSPDETAFFRWQVVNYLKQSDFSDISVEPFDFLHPFSSEGAAAVIIKAEKIFEKTPFLKEIAGSLFITAKKP